MEYNDCYIITGIRNRDRGVFHYLYERYFTPMVLFAESYLYDKEEARDCVQELFFKLWEQASCFQVSISLKAYLYTSVRNKCLNVLRDKRIHDSHHDKLFEATLFSGDEDSDVDENIRCRLQEALGSLPERCREIFILKVVKGMKNREIAEELNLAETTVKTQIQRAYRMLRVRMISVILLILFLKIYFIDF